MGKNFKEFLEFMEKKLNNDDDDLVLVKTIKIKKEWQPALNKLIASKDKGKALIAQLEKITRETSLLDDAFWAMVRLSSEDLREARRLTYDEKRMEIEVREEKKSKEDED